MNQKFTISQLNEHVHSYLEQANLKMIYVEGEISNYTKHHSGHVYFTLKDQTARISCVIFASNAKTLPELKDGISIIVLADFTYYKANSSGQLNIKKLKILGQGELFLKFEQLKKQLAKAGLFRLEHKKSIPEFPTSLGIITSVPSAALKDVLITLNNKCPNVDVTLYPTLVQGPQASTQIIKQLQFADTQNHDTLLLIRGGGSIEDLWCFNDEQLIHTIYALQTPIISGVGHEHDVTLVDYVCDKRAATPTAAAEASVYNLKEYQEKFTTIKNRMIQLIEQRKKYEKNNLNKIKNLAVFQDPNYLLQNAKMEVALYSQRIDSYLNTLQKQKNQIDNFTLLLKGLMQKNIKEKKYRLDTLQLQFLNHTKLLYQHRMNTLQNQIRSLDALSPLKVLARGYSIVAKEKVIITDSSKLKPTDMITIRFAQGKVLAEVKEKNDE